MIYNTSGSIGEAAQISCFFFDRERVICDRSFRSWLRRKNDVARKRKEVEHLSRRRSEREIRRTRKADKLINSLRQTSALKYYSV